MIKTTVLFFATFALGCVIALAVRTASHKPHDGHADVPAAPAYAPMVDNPSAPAKDSNPPTGKAGSSGHDMTAIPAPAAGSGDAIPASGKTVNTTCAICGMEVDPAVPTATYQGKTIGFGCKACPAKFAADPAKYGPYALRNEQAPE